MKKILFVFLLLANACDNSCTRQATCQRVMESFCSKGIICETFDNYEACLEQAKQNNFCEQPEVPVRKMESCMYSINFMKCTDPLPMECMNVFN